MGSFGLYEDMSSKLPIKYKNKPNKTDNSSIINTLIIDGNSLFKTGYHGAMNEYNSSGEKIGAIYQFMTVLRKLLDETVYHKCFVFWDGSLSGKLRYEIYKDYKSDRGKDFINGSVPDEEDYIIQQLKVKQYLEEIFVKQLTDDVVEADDFIALYCLLFSDKEKITICSNDMDLSQLVSNNVRLYNCGKGKKYYLTPSNFLEKMGYAIGNTVLIKTISGDNSDSISGILGVKEKTLLNNFPDLTKTQLTLDIILEQANTILKNRLESKKKPLKSISNIIDRKTSGIQGDKIYEINKKLVDLSKPLLTEKALNNFHNIINNKLDVSDRTIKNILTLFKRDGIDALIKEHNIDNYLLIFKKYMERVKGEF